MARTPKVEPTRYELDTRDAIAAHELEARAKAVIETVPGAADELATLTATLTGTRSSVTRAPGAVALREVVKRHAATNEGKIASAMLKAADGRYWAMVLRHDKMIQMDASSALRHGAPDFDDTVQLLRIGWFRGCMRFEPARGFKLPTMARNWGNVFEAIHRDRGPIRTSNKKTNSYPYVPYVRLDAPMVNADGDEGGRIGDAFADDATSVEETDARLRQDQRIAWIREEVKYLTWAQQRALKALYLEGDTVNDEHQYAFLIDVARRHGVSKQAISISHESGLLRLRDAMEDQGLWDEVDGAIPHRGARAEDWPLFAKRLDNAA